MSAVQVVLGLGSGAIVGFSLALIGGGGSILAVPLLVYLVGVPHPHVAIGTASLAVAVNAAQGLVRHARSGNVRWPCASVFASAGVAGAALGSSLGKNVDGELLLGLFAMLMLVVAALMFRHRGAEGDANTSLDWPIARRLLGTGGIAGTVSGFFGIGGGFLIVPSLMYAARLPILTAVGSSLVAVTAFGATTSVNYALNGWVDGVLALTLVVGGLLGSHFGHGLAGRLAKKRGLLNSVFATAIVAVAIYMLYRSVAALQP